MNAGTVMQLHHRLLGGMACKHAACMPATPTCAPSSGPLVSKAMPAIGNQQLRPPVAACAAGMSRRPWECGWRLGATPAPYGGRHASAASVLRCQGPADTARHAGQHSSPAAAACSISWLHASAAGRAHWSGSRSGTASCFLPPASRHSASSQRQVLPGRPSGSFATSAEPPDRGPHRSAVPNASHDHESIMSHEPAPQACATVPRSGTSSPSHSRTADSSGGDHQPVRQPPQQSQRRQQHHAGNLPRTVSAGLEEPAPSDKAATGAGWKERVAVTIRATFLTYYTAVFYNTVIRLLKWAGADALLARITPRLETAYAKLSGTWHDFPDGHRRPFSLANNYDPDFSVPPEYRAQDFPFAAESIPDVYRTDVAHFLSLAMKVVYEHNDVILDIIQREWGLQPLAIIETAPMIDAAKQQRWQQEQQRRRRQQEEDGGSAHSVPGQADGAVTEKKAATHDDPAFLPSSKAIVLRSKGGILIAFRGTEATNLLNWRTNITIQMTHHKDLGGVHDGFYAALFHRAGPDQSSLFEDLVACLRGAAASDAEAGEARQVEPIYLTGHSLGGALANVFAQALAAQEPELAEWVAGVYTWGEPRVGDAAFKRRWDATYGDRTFRIRNAGDIVPYLLPKWLGYRHKGKELFLTSFRGMKSDAKDIRKWALIENAGFPFLYLYKIFAGRLGQRRESWLRTFYRIVFSVTAPGFTDHFPCEYERKARYALEKGADNYGEAGSIADRR